ncbi:MAG: efflux RND transporter periplasmic adaptor subunit [Verrucomicrobia bacterium]|nr:efflux RND transporter periplasmic adaptor subunit [Verrucomicrobiota bacterium]
MGNAKSRFARNVIVISLIVVALAGAGGSYYYYKKRETIPIVQTEKVARRNLTELVVATGKIQPVIQVVINPEVSGEIIALPVKEGQHVEKGDLLLKIKPDNYIAQRNSIEATYKSALAGRSLAQANLHKAELEYARVKQLFETKLVSDSQFLEAQTNLEVAKASFETSSHQADQAKASLARAEDDLAKTTIFSPMIGTVTKLKSQVGERVLGQSMMTGTEIMTVANLNDMEARVDIGEMDVVLIALGQKARLEVDAFHDRKFTGEVYEIANAAKTAAMGTQQEATKFEVKIRIKDNEAFRPGMSVTAEVETRYRTNVLTVPIQCVTTRLPKGAEDKSADKKAKEKEDETPSNAPPGTKKKTESVKPIEIVFLADNGKATMAQVKRGISDDSYVEITEGVTEGQEVVSGGYKAINKELEDGKKMKVDNSKKKPGSKDGKKEEK